MQPSHGGNRPLRGDDFDGIGEGAAFNYEIDDVRNCGHDYALYAHDTTTHIHDDNEGSLLTKESVDVVDEDRNEDEDQEKYEEHNNEEHQHH